MLLNINKIKILFNFNNLRKFSPANWAHLFFIRPKTQTF